MASPFSQQRAAVSLKMPDQVTPLDHGCGWGEDVHTPPIASRYRSSRRQMSPMVSGIASRSPSPLDAL
jgi:hypothetical protein